MITTTNTISDNPHHSAVCNLYHRVLDAAAELSEKVDGTAESHDTHYTDIIGSTAELDTVSSINEEK